jgi:hypothetical protein
MQYQIVYITFLHDLGLSDGETHMNALISIGGSEWGSSEAQYFGGGGCELNRYALQKISKLIVSIQIE